MKSGEVVDYEIDEIRDLAAGLVCMRISEPKAMKSPLCETAKRLLTLLKIAPDPPKLMHEIVSYRLE
jgi:hypothetical protein